MIGARAAGLVAAALILLAWCVPAAAAGPVIDPGLLPRASSPTPPEATEQRTQCSLPLPAPDSPEPPAWITSLNFPAVWPLSTGRGQTVAVIDTGVAEHPRLPLLTGGGDYVSYSTGLDDCDAHGTVVAGLIAARPIPGSGFSGGAPDAAVLSIRQSSAAFSAQSASGEETEPEAVNSAGYGTVLTLARAIRRAADAGVTVINVSEVACGAVSTGLGDGALGAAVQYAATVKDAVIVAAAGNLGSAQCREQNPAPDPAHPYADGWNSVVTVASPAWFDDYVLTVGSVEPDGTASPFTLGGPWVDVAAPGRAMISLDPSGPGLIGGTEGANGTPVPLEGTSFAAPLVSATAALVRARYPNLTAAQVISRIEATAHSPAQGWNPLVGHGVVDPVAAVTTVLDGPPSNLPTDAPAPVALPLAPAAAPVDTRPREIAVGGVAVAMLFVALVWWISRPVSSPPHDRRSPRRAPRGLPLD